LPQTSAVGDSFLPGLPHRSAVGILFFAACRLAVRSGLPDRQVITKKMEPALAGDRGTDLVGGKPPPISECDIYGRASPTALPKGKPKTMK